MKKFFISVFLIVFGATYVLYSQGGMDNLPVKEKIKRLQYHTTVGTSFFYAGDFGSGSQFYVAPSLDYALSRRFSAFAGIAFSTTRFYGKLDPESNMPLNNNIPGLSAYAGGRYLVNERLSVYGVGIRSQMFSFPGPLNNTFTNPRSFNSIEFGTEFKINENLSIGGSVRFVDQNPYSLPFRE